MKLATYFLLVLQFEQYPKPPIILPFEDQEICQLAAEDLLGYESPNQCKNHITPPILKMNSRGVLNDKELK